MLPRKNLVTHRLTLRRLMLMRLPKNSVRFVCIEKQTRTPKIERTGGCPESG
jgi:hypothetical protein